MAGFPILPRWWLYCADNQDESRWAPSIGTVVAQMVEVIFLGVNVRAQGRCLKHSITEKLEAVCFSAIKEKKKFLLLFSVMTRETKAFRIEKSIILLEPQSRETLPRFEG